MKFLRRNTTVFEFPILKNVTFLQYRSESSPKQQCYPAANPNPQNLPLYPIPKLEYTIKKLIKSAQPFATTDGQFESFKDVCRKFAKCEGSQMQRYLIDRAVRSPNWVDEWYRKCSFLRKRDSLPMFSSPVLLFPLKIFRNTGEQYSYTAKLILAALKFQNLSRERHLPLEFCGKCPLDMSVYNQIFTNTRVPKPKCDELVVNRDSRHIVVMYRNNIFKLKVLSREGIPLSFKELSIRLRQIIENIPAETSPVGILTSHKRNEWADIYQQMQKSANDKGCLEAIEKALFAVCIDDSPPCDGLSIEVRKLYALENGFHGHGPEINGANRWHDKTLQFFVDRDGSSGIIFEHSSVDASTLKNLADFVVDYVSENRWMDESSIDINEDPLLLRFLPTHDLQCAINDASEHLRQKMKTFACKVAIYEDFGKQLWHGQLSPDGIMQTSLQCAHLYTHREFAAQQELGNTRKFHLGRNDVIRSFTPEVKAFIQGSNKTSVHLREKLGALGAAVRKHSLLTQEVMDGKGIDCHLFGLMMACKETGKHLPKLFQEPAYLECSKFRINSCEFFMKENCFVCYPPTCGVGYNVCYNPRPTNINISVSSKKDDSNVKLISFLENWAYCMKNIFDMLRSH